MMTTIQQRVLVGGLILILLGIGVWQGWVWFEQRKESRSVVEIKDPFEGFVIAEKYTVDPATRAVVEAKVAGTKAMYADKPDIWETWIAIGNVKRNYAEDYDGAIAAYRQSLALQFNNILGYRNIAEVYRENVLDYPKAAEYYSLAIENEADNPSLYASLAFVQYKQLGKNDAAEQTYKLGMARTGFSPAVFLPMIEFYKETGNMEKYAEAIRLLVEKYPDNASYRTTYGDELKAIGQSL